MGITWNNEINHLYAVNHGRDYLFNHAPKFYSEWDNTVLPADEFMKISKGDDFGWPYTYFDHFKKQRLVAPEYGGDSEKIASEKYKVGLSSSMAMPFNRSSRFDFSIVVNFLSFLESV